MRRILIALVSVLLFLAACSPGMPAATATATPDLVGTMVAATLAAVPSPTVPTQPPAATTTPIAAASPTPGTGTVAGRACYPSGSSAMTAYFEDTSSHAVIELPLTGGQPSYTADLNPGTYIAYAWLDDFSQGGSYSKCGAAAGCNDAKPLPFSVAAGATISGIDLCDWSHGPFDIPYPPSHSVESATGKISGTISDYPYGNLPSLTIVAFNQGNGYWYWVGTASRQSSYSITDLPPGSYQVVAYDSKNRAGGSPVVTVTAGHTVTADINKWGGGYPDNPVH